MSIDFHSGFLESTRGRIVAVLRRGSTTVDEIASELKLSHNAVRVQLTRMERDGLVRSAGFERRTTRPSKRFELTARVKELLSSAYVPLLICLLRAVAERRRPREVAELMRTVGRLMADEYHLSLLPKASLRARVAAASAMLNKEFGALTDVQRANGHFVIRGYGCPLAAVTGNYPAVCLVLESLLAELIGRPVTECCTRHRPPQCCFEIRGT